MCNSYRYEFNIGGQDMFHNSMLRGINLWQEMDRIQKEMQNLIHHTPGYGRTYPLINIWTKSDQAIATVELAGYNPEDIIIEVVGDELMLKGERSKPEIKEDECCHRQERRYGAFERKFQLPFIVEVNQVDAKFTNGILTIYLPRAEADKPKKIQIKTR
jgi:HSP20 family protein